MPKGLKRHYGQGHLHFLTFSCYRRLPCWGVREQENLFVKGNCAGFGESMGSFWRVTWYAESCASVDREPKKGTPSTVLQMLKANASPEMS